MTGERLGFDVETDGLLDVLTKIHVLSIVNLDTGEILSYSDDDPNALPLQDGIKRLEEAALTIGHNIIFFDIPAIRKVFPSFKLKGIVRDTMVMARLLWPSDILRDLDARKRQRGVHIPTKLTGTHKLEAWGYRLSLHKGDYAEEMEAQGLDPWAEWRPEMTPYCENDCLVTLELWKALTKKGYSEQAIELEHEVAWVISRQIIHGFKFNVGKAGKLYSTLVEELQRLEGELHKSFPPRYLPKPPVFTPKRDNAKSGYTAGAPLTKVVLTPFNPGSRRHIHLWLSRMRGWEPTEFTDGGDPKVDEEVLAALPYPEAILLNQYLMVAKRIGTVATGDNAWLKKVEADGRMHGYVNTNGANTRRMSHSSPNVSQVPASYSPYGPECRELFEASEGRVLVGCDADALELCCLAGYMVKYDGGEYVKVVLEGDKSIGTDIHSVNSRALGMDPKGKYQVGSVELSGRDIAKTWFYAFIYGAGDEKLGLILGKIRNPKTAGKKSRANFLANLPALGKLTEAVKDRVNGKVKGKPTTLVALDGGILKCRSAHSALNTLLQSAGALLMKQALIILDTNLSGVSPSTIGREGPTAATKLTPGPDYEFAANSHDEWQIDTKPDHVDTVGVAAKEAIRLAGEHFNFKCPLSGSYISGPTWKDTH